MKQASRSCPVAHVSDLEAEVAELAKEAIGGLDAVGPREVVGAKVRVVDRVLKP